MSNKKCNTKSLPIIIVALCMAVMLALYCSSFDLDNPIDPKFSYTLTVNASSGGTVSQTPEQESYAGGTEVTVTAVPNTDNGYVFAGWSGASTSNDATITIIMDENKTLTASFTPPTLTVSRNPTDAGNVTVTIGDDDPQDNPEGSQTVILGAEITLTVTPNNNYGFINWTAASRTLPEGVDSTNPTIIFNINNYVDIVANFMGLFNPNITYGSLVDSRDGQTYRTVVMPDGKTWMAENLNYRNPSWSHNDIITTTWLDSLDKGSWCYDNNELNCDIYGRLYTWSAAMEACPFGWRLPSEREMGGFNSANIIGGSSVGTKLKSAAIWQWDSNTPTGTNDYGFSALPGGYRDLSGDFYLIGDFGFWWSSTRVSNRAGYAQLYSLSYREEWWRRESNNFAMAEGHSVRCIRN